MVFIDYKNIDDSLTTDEFNAIVSLIKHNKILSDTIEINNGAVIGEYGTYTFDLESTTIVDNGILVTDETLASLGTVTLTNPVFANATYTLHLTVLSMEEPNILDDNKSETTSTDLEIVLVKDVAVPIPFETLANYCIIVFDAKIEIKQDKPVIGVGKEVTDVSLSTNKQFIKEEETASLTALATESGTFPVHNASLKLYANNDYLDTLSTNFNGQAKYDFTSNSDGLINFQVKYSNTIHSEIIKVWDCLDYDIGTTASHNDDLWVSTTYITRYDDYSILTGTSTQLGYIEIDDNMVVELDVMTDQSVNSQLGRIATGTTQLLTFSLTGLGLTANEWHHLKIEIKDSYCTISNTENTNTITGDVTGFNRLGIRANSNNQTYFKNVCTYYLPLTLNITASDDIIQTGDTTTLTVTLLRGSTALTSKTVNLYKDGTLIDTLTTDENGESTYTYTGTGAGDVSFQAEYGIFLSETYSIEDCIYYNTNQTSATLNINLPSNFSISWKVHRTNGTLNDNGLSQPQLQDSTHNYYIGQFGSLGNWGFIIRNQGSSSNLVRKDGSPNIPNDTEKTILYTYNNGVHTCEVDGNSVTDTNSYAPTKLDNVIVGSMNVMQNLKIKPL